MKRDQLVFDLINKELERQRHGIELIASENFASLQVVQSMGNVMTNKYAEGYPGRRYYGGCEIVDQTEQLAIDRLKQIFDCEYANVQPHSGAQANAARDYRLLLPDCVHNGPAVVQLHPAGIRARSRRWRPCYGTHAQWRGSGIPCDRGRRE